MSRGTKAYLVWESPRIKIKTNKNTTNSSSSIMTNLLLCAYVHMRLQVLVPGEALAVGPCCSAALSHKARCHVLYVCPCYADVTSNV